MITLPWETVGVIILAALLAWHIGIHGWRERQVKELRDHIRRLESLNASLALRYTQLALRFAEKFPEHKSEMTDIVDSLTALLHEFQKGTFQPGVSINAGRDFMSGGDVIGHDKKEA